MRNILTLIILSLLLANCNESEQTIQSSNGAHSYNTSTQTELNYNYPNKPHYTPYNIKFNNNY